LRDRLLELLLGGLQTNGVDHAVRQVGLLVALELGGCFLGGGLTLRCSTLGCRGAACHRQARSADAQREEPDCGPDGRSHGCPFEADGLLPGPRRDPTRLIFASSIESRTVAVHAGRLVTSTARWPSARSLAPVAGNSSGRSIPWTRRSHCSE